MRNPFSKQRRPAPPPAVPGDEVVPLPGRDDTHINRSLILNFMLRFDSVLDPEKLNSSLDTVLNQPGWRKIGARLRLNDKGKLEYHVPERFDDNRPAFAASHVDVGTSIAKHPLASEVPRGAPGDAPAIVADSFRFRPLIRPDDGPTKIEDYLHTDRPQLGVHVMSFTDATLVSLTWPHTLWDAMGRRAFLLAWTAALAGDAIPPAYDAAEDPLRDFGVGDSGIPPEEHKLLSKRLSVPQMILFGLRHFWEGFRHRKEEGRVVCLPAAFISRLRADAKTAAGDVFLSDGDLISAWCARLVAEHVRLPPGRTVCLINALGWRSILQPDIISSDTAYIGNAAGGAFAHISAGEVLSEPLAHTAGMVRRSIKEQGTRGQVEASARLTAESPRVVPMYGDATMQLVIVSNWSKGKFFEMDFSPAIVAGSNAASGDEASRGKAVYIHACAFNSGYSVRNAFQVSGKDTAGNYWLSSTLRAEVWDSVERNLRGTAEA